MKSDQYYLAELEDKILNTIYAYVETVPRPFGILLSGGFDSGLLAAITKPDFVYSLRFPYGTTYDESRYADAIIDHLNLRAKTTIIAPTKADFEKNFKEAVQVMGEPVGHFSLVPLYLLFKTIKYQIGHDADFGKKEVNILSGEGPDEYLGGYARQIIFDELNKLYDIPELRGYHGFINKVLGVRDRFNLVKKYAEVMGYSEEEATPYWHLYGYGEMEMHGAIGRMDMELGVIEKMEQKFAEHFGVKLHYPYINDQFASYCYRLPDHLKVRNGVTKWAFRQICKKYLPEFVMDRMKMGGPVFPVNKLMGWMENGEFDKTRYLVEQDLILNPKAYEET